MPKAGHHAQSGQVWQPADLTMHVGLAHHAFTDADEMPAAPVARQDEVLRHRTVRPTEGIGLALEGDADLRAGGHARKDVTYRGLIDAAGHPVVEIAGG